MAGVRSGELERRGGHDAASRERHGADHRAPGIETAEGIDLRARLGELGEGEPHATREAFGFACRSHTECRGLEQRDPEPPLELPRGAVQRRPGEPGDLRRCAESAVLDDGGERLQLHRRHGVGGTGEMPIAGPRVACLGEPVANLLPGARRTGPHVLARLGRRDPTAGAIHQPSAESGFEPGEDLTDGGLRKMHGSRGRADAALAGELEEYIEVAQVRQRFGHSNGSLRRTR